MNITNRETALAELLAILKREASDADVSTEGSIYDLVLALSGEFDSIDWSEFLVDLDFEIYDEFDFGIDDITLDLEEEESVVMRMANYGNVERAEFDEALNTLVDTFVSRVKEARR